MSFFISRNFVKSSKFHLIHEFSEFEEIRESLLNIYSNLKSVRFEFIPYASQKKHFFAILNCFEAKNYFAKDMLASSDLKIVNPDVYLLNKISSKINLKVLTKLEIGFKMFAVKF